MRIKKKKNNKKVIKKNKQTQCTSELAKQMFQFP